MEHAALLMALAIYWGDNELNSPNDVTFRRDGSIFFIDPILPPDHYGLLREKQIDIQGVWIKRTGQGDSVVDKLICD